MFVFDIASFKICKFLDHNFRYFLGRSQTLPNQIRQSEYEIVQNLPNSLSKY